MNAKVEKIENNKVRLEVTVEAEKFKEAEVKAYFKNAKKFNIPGFRKGKAPINIIKRYYGEGVFYEDTVNFCVESTYPEVIKENDLRVVDYPELEILDLGEGKELKYAATVSLYPEVELGQYMGVEVKKVEYPVSDEEIEKQLKAMQEKNARIEAKDENGIVEKGDMVTIDFKGFVDGKAFEGGEAKDYSLEVGSGTFIDTFEDQLIGLKKDEEKEVLVNFPEEYGREDLNGKPATFSVKIKEIKLKELPEIDDEFAKEVSEFDTIEELKADTKNKMEESNNSRSEKEYEDNVIEAVSANAKANIPESMVEREIDNLMKDLEMRLQYQGLDLKTYYEYTNNTEEKVREFMKENAEKKVKSEIVIEKIAKVEEIEASDDEIKAKATEMAKSYSSKDEDKFVEMLLQTQKEFIKSSVVNEKVIKLLVSNSKAI